MTEEQKIEALQRILQGANVAQVNLGDGYQTFNLHNDDGNKRDDAQVVEAEEVAGAANNKPEDETGKDHELCFQFNSTQQAKLKAAEEEGIIKYNPKRKGYVVGDQSSNVLVAYLGGKMFCGDYTNKNGQWKAGGIFNEAKHCKKLFDFDVAGTRRSAQGNGAGKSPKGHERVDKIFE